MSSRPTIKVLVSPDVVEMFSTRTEDGRRIETQVGEPDEYGVAEMYFFTTEDESTQAYRDGIAMGRLMAAPAWGAESAEVCWDHQKGTALAMINGYTSVRGEGKTIEEACDKALAQLHELNSIKKGLE